MHPIGSLSVIEEDCVTGLTGALLDSLRHMVHPGTCRQKKKKKKINAKHLSLHLGRAMRRERRGVEVGPAHIHHRQPGVCI